MLDLMTVARPWTLASLQRNEEARPVLIDQAGVACGDHCLLYFKFSRPEPLRRSTALFLSRVFRFHDITPPRGYVHAAATKHCKTQPSLSDVEGQ